MGCCHHYQFSAGGDDLFTVDVNRIRFGPGALRELGSEVALEGVKNAAVFTDTVIAQLELFSGALQSLRAAGVAIEVYDEVRVEPTDQSFQAAGALVQQRLLSVSPREVQKEDLHSIYTAALRYW